MIPVCCVAPGCSVIVRDGGSRCERHRSQQRSHRTKVRAEQRREQSKKKSFIYDTASWRRLSKKKRTVDPFCEECLLKKPKAVYKQADVVDHIVELEDGGNPYLWSNLRSLCHACHASKTQAEKKKRKSIILG